MICEKEHVTALQGIARFLALFYSETSSLTNCSFWSGNGQEDFWKATAVESSQPVQERGPESAGQFLVLKRPRRAIPLQITA